MIPLLHLGNHQTFQILSTEVNNRGICVCLLQKKNSVLYSSNTLIIKKKFLFILLISTKCYIYPCLSSRERFQCFFRVEFTVLLFYNSLEFFCPLTTLRYIFYFLFFCNYRPTLSSEESSSHRMCRLLYRIFASMILYVSGLKLESL